MKDGKMKRNAYLQEKIAKVEVAHVVNFYELGLNSRRMNSFIVKKLLHFLRNPHVVWQIAAPTNIDLLSSFNPKIMVVILKIFQVI